MLPAALEQGVAGLDGVERLEVLGPPEWCPGPGVWAVRFRVELGEVAEGSPVPDVTDWFVITDAAYPWGVVKVCPAAERGLTVTFQHQRHNGEPEPGLPWRPGTVCTDTPGKRVLRRDVDDEPYAAESRLAWHAGRLCEWLSDAVTGTLVQDGEPFELPDFPIRDRETRVCFAETASTLVEVGDVAASHGMLRFHGVAAAGADLLIVDSFRDANENEVGRRPWGTAISAQEERKAGIWLRLDGIPVLAPWQAPSTWGELRTACEPLGVDLDAVLRPLLNRLRDGRRHVLLIGFPIPRTHGSEATQVSWQGLMLPRLSRGKEHAPGFRANEQGHWLRDQQRVFTPETPITWLETENWAKQELATRGQLTETIRSQPIQLIGAGALGSAVADLLVRGGAHELTVVDHDTFEAGNLVRHTLGLVQLGAAKATALANRLNLASPHAKVTGIAAAASFGDVESVGRSHIIIDATANDAVLHDMSSVDLEEARTFVTVSVGAFARRLFFYAMRGTSFDHADFRARVEPLLMEERELLKTEEFPREGTGCWDPVFPARADDIWLFASAAVKELETYCDSRSDDPSFVVYERVEDEGVFSGLARVAE